MQLGTSLGDVRMAQELDSRDQLAGLRDKFHVPLISELLEEEEKALILFPPLETRLNRLPGMYRISGGLLLVKVTLPYMQE